jgi:A/G-specific adenine glycosylase
MDVGAAFCRPRAPRCDACPLQGACLFRASADAVAPLTRSKPVAAKRGGTRFEATSRWLRGRVLDRLRDAPDGAWVLFDSPIGDHDLAAVEVAVAALASEGQIESRDRRARLPLT